MLAEMTHPSIGTDYNNNHVFGRLGDMREQ